MPITLEKLISRHARYRRDRLAVVFGEQRLTWAQFDAGDYEVSYATRAAEMYRSSCR